MTDDEVKKLKSLGLFFKKPNIEWVDFQKNMGCFDENYRETIKSILLRFNNKNLLRLFYEQNWDKLYLHLYKIIK
jgi:hypothetical protein